MIEEHRRRAAATAPRRAFRGRFATREQGRGGGHHRSKQATPGDPRRRSPTSEGDTTTFELFFDLVYVFAVTQVTGYLAHTHDALGMLQGLLVLALLWRTWSGYAWLGNQARAVVVDWGGIYLTSRAGNWRIHSASHWTERQGQFVILAIGESVVAIGAGAAGQPIGAPLLAAAVLGVAAALGPWWLYFDVVSDAAEHRLRDARGQARVRMALKANTYGHFPIVAGIIVGAVGVRGVLAHAGDDARPGGRATARHRVAADVTVAALSYPPGAVADRSELLAAARPAAWRPRRLRW